jgi:hypothetical protein
LIFVTAIKVGDYLFRVAKSEDGLKIVHGETLNFFRGGT